jgi:hypothetical protein
VERGDVAEMHKRYGSQEGRHKGGRPGWKSLKVTVNKREQIYKQLVSEFNSNKDQFFEFFTVSCNAELGSEGGKRKRKHANAECQLRALNKVAEAIPRQDRDLKEEMALPAYQGECGDISQDLWDVRWAGQNRWEVWRLLGKEK